MNEFTFLFRYREGSRQRDRISGQKWAAWIKNLNARGLITNPGQPLANAGRLVDRHGRNLRSTSFVDLKDAIDGFLVVAARDLGEAVEISMGCPVFEEGGSVEVRPVEQVQLQ